MIRIQPDKTVVHYLLSRKYRNLILSTLFLLFTGSLIFHYAEGWRWFDALYYCVMTLATVGYGDFAPHTDLGKLMTIVYVVSGIGIFLTFIQSYLEFVKEPSRYR